MNPFRVSDAWCANSPQGPQRARTDLHCTRRDDACRYDSYPVKTSRQRLVGMSEHLRFRRTPLWAVSTDARDDVPRLFAWGHTISRRLLLKYKFSAVELFLVLDRVLVLVRLGLIAPAAHADQCVELSPFGQLPLLAVWSRVGILLIDRIVAREDLVDLLEE